MELGKKKKNAKLKIYNNLKEKKEKEHILHEMDILAKAITLRIKSGTNFLRIDKGRHLNIKRNERICQGCNLEVENEEHFLLRCINYKKIRNNWLYPIKNWTKNEKLKLLMGYNVEDIKKKKKPN